MAKSVVNVDIDLNTAPIEKLESELEQVNEQLKGMERGTKEFESMAAESAKLTNALTKANAAAEGFTDEKKFQAADGAIKVLGGSLASVVGVLGTLGIESEAFGDIEKKAASAIAVAIGFKDLSEGFKQIKDSAVLASAKTKLFGITTKQALIATGIGIFVVALGTVVAYWDDITKAVNKFGESVPFVGKAIDGIKSAFDSLFEAARPVLEFLGILPDEAERAAIAFEEQTNENVRNLKRQISIQTAAGAEAKKLFDLRKQLIEEEIALLKLKEDAEQELFDKTTELLTLEAAERKRIADEQVDNIERVSVATVNALTTKSVTMLETEPIVADLLDLTTAAEIRKRQADEASAKAAEESMMREIGKQEALYATGEALGALGSIMNQESAAAKALAISQAVINTYLGVTEVLKQESTLPSPFDVIVKIANVATILASGFAAVRGIKSTPPSGGGTVSPAGGSSRGATGQGMQAPPTPVAAPTVPTVQPTVQAYVISGDVTSGQEADARLSKRRSLG